MRSGRSEGCAEGFCSCRNSGDLRPFRANCVDPSEIIKAAPEIAKGLTAVGAAILAERADWKKGLVRVLFGVSFELSGKRSG
jgi:hypothetical protein